MIFSFYLYSSIPALSAVENLLHIFVQNNHIGPPIDIAYDTSAIDKIALDELGRDGESPFALTRLPSLLWIAKRISEHMLSTTSHLVRRVITFMFLDFCVRHVPIKNPLSTPNTLL